jgi:hypothetical protein
MKLASLLSGGTPTAADLKAAAERADTQARAAIARLGELTQQRLDGLLGDADDKALDRIEAELTRVTRDRDRAEAAAVELWRRHGEAVEAERQAVVDAIHERGQVALRRGVELITKTYPKLAAPLVKLGLELDDLERQVALVNQELRQAGDPRTVADIDQTARPPARPADQLAVGFTSLMVLPSATDRVALAYPPHERDKPMQVGRAA